MPEDVQQTRGLLKGFFFGGLIMKKCINCGKTLPDDAVFCPWCETDQNERQEIEAPAKKNWMVYGVLIASVIVLLTVCLLLYLKHRPETIEGGATISYNDGKTEWTVLTTFDRISLTAGIGQENIDMYLPVDSDSHIYDQLYALRAEDARDMEAAAAAAEIFYEQVESIEYITDAPSGKNALSVSGPARNTDMLPQAVSLADLHYFPTNGKSTLTWKIHMKNKDTLILQHTMSVTPQEIISVSDEEYPMETAQQLNELLKTLEDKYPHDVIEIILPAVTYDEPVQIKNRGFNLTGTVEGGNATTFTETLEVFTRNMQITEITGVNFEGSGGNGIVAHEGVILNNCLFFGWDTAVYGQEGSWPMLSGVEFRDNQTAFLFDSSHATCSNTGYEENVFENNGTAVQLENVPGQGTLEFTGCRFEGNENDLINNSSYTVEGL